VRTPVRTELSREEAETGSAQRRGAHGVGTPGGTGSASAAALGSLWWGGPCNLVARISIIFESLTNGALALIGKRVDACSKGAFARDQPSHLVTQ